MFIAFFFKGVVSRVGIILHNLLFVFILSQLIGPCVLTTRHREVNIYLGCGLVWDDNLAISMIYH